MDTRFNVDIDLTSRQLHFLIRNGWWKDLLKCKTDKQAQGLHERWSFDNFGTQLLRDLKAGKVEGMTAKEAMAAIKAEQQKVNEAGYRFLDQAWGTMVPEYKTAPWSLKRCKIMVNYIMDSLYLLASKHDEQLTQDEFQRLLDTHIKSKSTNLYLYYRVKEAGSHRRSYLLAGGEQFDPYQYEEHMPWRDQIQGLSDHVEMIGWLHPKDAKLPVKPKPPAELMGHEEPKDHGEVEINDVPSMKAVVKPADGPIEEAVVIEVDGKPVEPAPDPKPITADSIAEKRRKARAAKAEARLKGEPETTPRKRAPRKTPPKK